MRILFVTRYYGRNSFAGVERFLRSLQDAFKLAGHSVLIIWTVPQAACDDDYMPGVALVNSPASRFENASSIAPRIEKLLEQFRPDVAHFNTFGRAEAVVARLLTMRGIRYGYLYNSPSCACRRSDLLRWGSEICDGEVRAVRCSACKWNHRFHTPRFVSRWMGALDYGLGCLSHVAKENSLAGQLARYREDFEQFLRNAGAYLLHAEWPARLLLINGAVDGRFYFFEQGISSNRFVQSLGVSTVPEIFTVGFIGRREPNKGIHLAVAAFRRLKDSNVRFLIAGGTSGPKSQYEIHLQQLANGDDRIQFLPPLAEGDLAALYRKLSLVVIPSIWLETGPLVMREAIAAGVPVLASSTMGDVGFLKRTGVPPVRVNTVDEWSIRLRACHAQFLSGKLSTPRDIKIKTEAEMNAGIVRLYETLAAGGNDGLASSRCAITFS